jgi:hypothetical protein
MIETYDIKKVDELKDKYDKIENILVMNHYEFQIYIQENHHLIK